VIERAVFYDRLENFCKKCPHWKGVCLKGHSLSSDLGCPIRNFPGVNGADYAPENQAQVVTPQPCTSCGDASMPSLSWPEVMAAFAESLAKWIKAGVPLVNRHDHALRYGQCKDCNRFRKFYCEHCKCLAYLKTKLATEVCPLKPPRWI